MPCVIRDNTKASAANDKSISYKVAWLRYSYGEGNEMSDSIFELMPETETEIRQLFPVEISDTDMDFVADWFLSVGIATVKTALTQHPELTLGSLINLTFKIHDS